MQYMEVIVIIKLINKLSIKNINHFIYMISIILISFLAVFLRFYKLDSVPAGLHVDEVAMGYNALCLSQYGVDRYLVNFPVYFMNYASGQSAMSTYLSALLIQVFGFSIFTIRLPGIIFSLETVLTGALIIKEKLGRRAALIGATLLTVIPYFIMQSRFGLDCNLMLGASTIFLYLLIKSIKKQSAKWWCLSGIVCGLTLYTYALSYLVMPMFLLLLMIYLLIIKKLRIKHFIIFTIPAALISLPLLVYVFINVFDLPTIQIMHFTIPNLPGFSRSSELGFENIFANIETFFTCSFFKDWLPYNAFTGHYTLYLISIPFAIKGLDIVIRNIIASIKKRQYDVDVIIFIFLLSVFFLSLLIEGPNINKLNAMYFCWVYMITRGIYHIQQRIEHKRLFALLLSGLYSLSFLLFFNYYFYVYPKEEYPQFLFYPDLEYVCAEVEDLNPTEQPVYYSLFEHADLYFAFANQLSPYEINISSTGHDAIENNYFFWPEDGINTEAIYVIWEINYDHIVQLEEAGFIRRNDGPYFIYSSGN